MDGTMNLTDAISHAWLTTENGKGQDVSAVVGAPSYVVRGVHQECSVAIPLVKEIEVNEEFAAVRLTSIKKSVGGRDEFLLMLTHDGAYPPKPFAALCAEFLYPGVNGEFRRELLENPVAWWRGWKEVLGNQDIELRVYDVLGELCVLKLLSQKHPGGRFSWHGPAGSTYDIHSQDALYEVKSTIVKGDKRIVIHNAFQLDAGVTPLYLMHCVFEPSIAGVSINALVDELVVAGTLEPDAVEQFLSGLGLARGKSIRNKKYLLLSVDQYKVDERFPVLMPLPTGVIDLEFTLELAGFESTKIL